MVVVRYSIMKKKLSYISILIAFSVAAYFLWIHKSFVTPISTNADNNRYTDDKYNLTYISTSMGMAESTNVTSAENTLNNEEPSSADFKKEHVVRYGVIRTNSTSGELRLSYYNIKQKKVLNNWQRYPWFFATPENIEDLDGIKNQYDYVESHSGAIFKITGIKDSDDCEYYGNGICLESIVIKQIEAIMK